MILNQQRAVRVTLRPLELFAARVCKTLGLRKTDATICLVSDADIARMNATFRKKKRPTDVLSFPVVERKRPAPLRRTLRFRRSNGRDGEQTYVGDIAISPATARRNALQDGRPLHDELRILILHGMLHLLGYDHEADRGRMSRIERRLRRRFGLA